jgi:hypothetical protein
MNELPPDLAAFATLLDAQPGPVREAFAYCLCLVLVETGKMERMEVLPGEITPIHVFRTLVGDTFSVPRPPMSEEQEVALIALLREILDEEGML